MIYQNSRYYTQLIDYIALSSEGDNYPIVFYEFDTKGVSTWYEHIYAEGERLDFLSYKYFFRSDFWWLIAEFNPKISDFTNITPGTVLRIPRV
ncbi:MAG: hypothetical protein WCG95_07995 [bacterium]|jgi:hypothetical protein